MSPQIEAFLTAQKQQKALAAQIQQQAAQKLIKQQSSGAGLTGSTTIAGQNALPTAGAAGLPANLS
jgi:hypothetical protein